MGVGPDQILRIGEGIEGLLEPVEHRLCVGWNLGTGRGENEALEVRNDVLIVIFDDPDFPVIEETRDVEAIIAAAIPRPTTGGKNDSR